MTDNFMPAPVVVNGRQSFQPCFTPGSLSCQHSSPHSAFAVGKKDVPNLSV